MLSRDVSRLERVRETKKTSQDSERKESIAEAQSYGPAPSVSPLCVLSSYRGRGTLNSGSSVSPGAPRGCGFIFARKHCVMFARCGKPLNIDFSVHRRASSGIRQRVPREGVWSAVYVVECVIFFTERAQEIAKERKGEKETKQHQLLHCTAMAGKERLIRRSPFLVEVITKQIGKKMFLFTRKYYIKSIYRQ